MIHGSAMFHILSFTQHLCMIYGHIADSMVGSNKHNVPDPQMCLFIVYIATLAQLKAGFTAPE
jgi:hypothetical protein